MLDVSLARRLNSFAGRWRPGDLLIVLCARYFAYLFVLLYTWFLIDAPILEGQRTTVLFLALAASILARIVIVEGVRFFYKRPRPFITLQLKQLVPSDRWSFPSGHAAFFFALSSVAYFFLPVWGAIFFLATVVISIARIMAGVHYPSDILAGLLTGVGAAYGILYVSSLL